MTKPTERTWNAAQCRSARSPGLRPLCLTLAAVIVFQLLYLGAQPFAAGLIPVPWDKLAHLAVFGAIAALLWVGTAGRIPLLTVAAVMVIGAIDELRQIGLPGRSADLLDFLVDACAASGTVLMLHTRRR